MENMIERYRRMTNMRRLKEEYRCGYAFVGIGGHSTQNLYPAIDYLHIPLSYICCRDARKIPIIERKYRGVKATTRLEDILDDDNVRGVFVCTGSKTHYEMATRVLTAGKSLFIEKPPCGTLRQLEELAKTAGSKVLAKIIQKKEKPDPATYIGSGRLREIRDFCRDNEADLIIFDCELSPSQQRNVENFTDVRVIDRTTLILDIFAARARSNFDTKTD